MHHESPNPNRGLPRGAAGKTAPLKLATILSSESSKSIDRKGGKNCDGNNPFFTHWKRHLFTFAFGCFDSEVRNKISSLRGASIFSWSRDWPFLVSVNCDVPEAYNFEFGVICFWMYWKTALWILIEIHSVKRELPKSSILDTSHTEDEYWRNLNKGLISFSGFLQLTGYEMLNTSSPLFMETTGNNSYPKFISRRSWFW